MQMDAPSRSGTDCPAKHAHTSQWPVGEPFRDHALCRCLTEMPPGNYQVLVGLYDGESGERLGGRRSRWPRFKFE